MKYIKFSHRITSAAFCLAASFLLIASCRAQNNEAVEASDLKLDLEKLNTLGSVLYIAAHPDDENNALLAYFAKGLHLRTGYLSLTRGDGGQNLIGTEQGDELGVLRTQELLAARRIDGAEQFFTRAIDFGFSKSAEETFNFWGKDKILSDVVWVIRKFRPDVIITRFSGTKDDGHGNHTASELLAVEAFKISGDSTKFPEQLKYVRPWQAKRIFWNAWPPLLERRKIDLSKIIKVDVGAYNPLLGESYSEIAAKARSMHKSQGFGSSGRLGEINEYFFLTGGQPAEHSLFEGINLTWNRVPGGEEIGKILSEANRNFEFENPAKIIPLLMKAYGLMKKIQNNYWIDLKEKELAGIIQLCAGIKIESNASDYSAVPGQTLSVTSQIINRSKIPFVLKKIDVDYQNSKNELNYNLANEKFYSIAANITLPEDIAYSQPYWLKEEHGEGDYVVNDQQLIGSAENLPPVNAVYTLSLNGEDINLKIPVSYKWNDPVQGEEHRPFIIVPPAAINIESKNYLFPDDSTREVKINLIANEDSLSGNLKLNIPVDWKSEPQSESFFLKKKNDITTLTFNVTPPQKSSDVYFNAEAEIGSKIVSTGMMVINHPHIPIQTEFPPAKAKLIRLNVKKVIDNIGYIMGPGDDVPVYLRELGYNVDMLTDKQIENDDLSKYDAIITGIRLYNTDNKISFEQPKLLNYVKNGGTLVVQYNKNYDLVTKKIGPYPFNISTRRVTDENAAVNFLDAESPLLNFPNKITSKDFDGWIQERGVYFADEWDNKYKTVIACNDPGEEPLAGGLLYTKYGKGVFIYTGYDWFRELPEGVPGAYRIFVNLISAGKANLN